MTTKKLTDYMKQPASTQSTEETGQPKPIQARTRFKKETEFQETPIGKIPKEWKITTLKDIALISSGNTAPQEKKFFEGGKFPFIRVQHLNNLEEQKYPTQYDLINELAISELKLKKFKKGSIIFPKSGESIRLEKRAILREDSFVVNHLAVVEPIHPEVHNMFLFYYLCTIKTSNYLAKTTMPSLNLSTIRTFHIPLPPVAEQKVIAEILSTIDLAIDRVKRLVERAEKLKKGLMRELFTKGIGHKEFQETPIGKIPKEWRIVRLGDVVEVWDNYRIPVKEQDREKGEYPYCGANGIIDYVNGYTHDGEFVLLAEDGGFFGPYEKSAYIMRGKIWANNHVHVLKAIEERTTNEFLMFYLNFMDLRPFLTGSTRPKLTQKDMLRIPIPLPPLSEQREITKILSSVDEYIRVLRARLERLERVKEWLMDVLLTGKVRVMVEPSSGVSSG